MCKYQVFVNCQLLKSSSSFKTNFCCLHGFHEEGKKYLLPTIKVLDPPRFQSWMQFAVFYHALSIILMKIFFPHKRHSNLLLGCPGICPSSPAGIVGGDQLPLAGDKLCWCCHMLLVEKQLVVWQKGLACGPCALPQHQQPARHARHVWWPGTAKRCAGLKINVRDGDIQLRKWVPHYFPHK